MRNLIIRVAADAAIPLLPVLAIQAYQIRRRTPRVPPAGGPDRGYAPAAGPPLRLVLLGESPVDGVGVASHEQALGGRVAASLAERTGRGVHWRAVGRNGVTARVARRLLIPRLHGERADLLVIALGVNDSMYLSSPRRWSFELRRLIQEARAHLGPATVVLSAVPPIERFPALAQPLSGILGLRARTLDAASRRLARAMPDVHHVSLTLASRPEHFCYDGFHPSPLGYASWGDILAEGAARIPSVRAAG